MSVQIEIDRPWHALYSRIARSCTERGAIAASHYIGSEDKNACDEAATAAMRQILDSSPIRATVVSGEGKMDGAPGFDEGMKLGRGWEDETTENVCMAVDPVEGTSLCAVGEYGAWSVMAISEEHGLCRFPDAYALKMAVGPEAKEWVDFEGTLKANLFLSARAMHRKADTLRVGMLNRDRHAAFKAEARLVGARLLLPDAGDLPLSVATAMGDTNLHMCYGIGGGPEGVLTAAAMKGLNGAIWMRLAKPQELPEHDGKEALEASREMKRLGYKDPYQMFSTSDLAPGKKIVFVATGITPSLLLNGVRQFPTGHRAHSIVISYEAPNYRKVELVESIYGNNETVFQKY